MLRKLYDNHDIRQGGMEYLTNAAVLLFAKNIMQFYSNCRVRFLRIDGRELQVGDKFIYRLFVLLMKPKAIFLISFVCL